MSRSSAPAAPAWPGRAAPPGDPAPVGSPARHRLLPVPALAGVAGLAVLGGVVEVVPRLGIVNPKYLPPTSSILRMLISEVGTGEFWAAVGETMRAWAIGLAIAFTAAVVLGCLIGTSRVLRRFTASTVEFLRPIPSVALIPLAAQLFATGIGSPVMLVVYASFWQVLVQVLYGVADVDPIALETGRTYRFRAWARLRHIIWPAALPFVLTGLRLAAAVALILAITAELVLQSPGLGNLISQAREGNAVALMYALVVATGLIGVAINVLVRLAERRLLFWHPSVRVEAGA